MTMFTKGLLSLLPVILLGSVPASEAAASSVAQKPQLPLQVEIISRDRAVRTETLKAGDAAELIVRATAHADADEMRIIVELLEGVEHVSGVLSWGGPVKRKAVKELHLGVRLPASGQGAVKTTVTLVRAGAKIASRTAQKRLGAAAPAERSKSSRAVKTDSKGRKIVEY